MTALCKDCGMDTEPWPPHRGTQEHFIVKNEIWAAAGMPPGKVDPDDMSMRGGGILCVGCIEKRLGRLLTINDFAPRTLDLLKSCEHTPRLLSRVGINFMAIANQPLPEHIVEQWMAAIIMNALKREPLGRKLRQVEVDGDEVALTYTKAVVRCRAGPETKALMAALRRDQVPEEPKIDLLVLEVPDRYRKSRNFGNAQTRPRGRPKTGKALSAAEKMRRYRARLREGRP
jgi:hypothetical protein